MDHTDQTPLDRAAGRFGPGKQFFLCKTEEEVKALEELGFVTDPSTLKDPYSSEEAKHIQKLEDLVFDADEKKVTAALEKKGKGKKADAK